MISYKEVFDYWKEKIEKENYNVFNYQPYTNQDRVECIEQYEKRFMNEIKNTEVIDSDHANFRKFTIQAFKELKSLKGFTIY